MRCCGASLFCLTRGCTTLRMSPSSATHSCSLAAPLSPSPPASTKPSRSALSTTPLPQHPFHISNLLLLLLLLLLLIHRVRSTSGAASGAASMMAMDNIMMDGWRPAGALLLLERHRHTLYAYNYNNILLQYKYIIITVYNNIIMHTVVQ